MRHGAQPSLTMLPVELLYEIQLLARSDTLPQTCKALHGIFASSPPSHRAQYLRACASSTPRAREDAVLTKILRYPICTADVLEAHFRWGSAGAPSAPQLPRRLFRQLGRHEAAAAAATARTATTGGWTDLDPPLPFLRYLYGCPHLPPPNANAHEGYALTKAVLAGFVPLVRFLLDHGARPAGRGNLAIALAIHRRDLGLVRMLVERVDTRTSISGKRRKLEDRVQVTPEMLKIAVKCKAQDIVEYLTREKGCIPDLQTLLLMR